MPTQKQKRVAKLIIENTTLDEPLNAGEIVANSGYGVSMKKNPQVILSSLGVQEALEVAGFDEKNAKKVVAEIMLNPDADNSSRLKATDQVFKVRGAYAPEKSVNLNLNGETIPNEELEGLAKQLNDIARSNNRPSVTSDGADTNAMDAKIQD